MPPGSLDPTPTARRLVLSDIRVAQRVGFLELGVHGPKHRMVLSRVLMQVDLSPKDACVAAGLELIQPGLALGGD